MAKVKVGYEGKMFSVKIGEGVPRQLSSKQAVLKILEEHGITGIQAQNMVSKNTQGQKPARTTHVKQIKTCHRPPKARRQQQHHVRV